ncbi:MAG: hypothetical protein AAF798_08905 [Bacteroidota bacterium]
MKKITLILGLLIAISGTMLAQADSLLLTNGFKFKDGIYLSFNDFQNNQPAFTWEQLEASLVTSARNMGAQVEYIRQREGAPIPLSAVWGFSLKGIPYIQVPAVDKAYAKFAGFKIRGKICFFIVEQEQSQKVEIKAYNPLTRRPFRKGEVENEVLVEQGFMLHFETGAIADFNYEEVLQWIADDKELLESVTELTEEEVAQKLYKCIMIYDDRNGIKVPNRQ